MQEKVIPLNIKNNMFREWVLVWERKIEGRCSSMVRERDQEAEPDYANACWSKMDPLMSHHYNVLFSPSIIYLFFLKKDQPNQETEVFLNMGLWGIVQLGFI